MVARRCSSLPEEGCLGGPVAERGRTGEPCRSSSGAGCFGRSRSPAPCCPRPPSSCPKVGRLLFVHEIQLCVSTNHFRGLSVVGGFPRMSWVHKERRGGWGTGGCSLGTGEPGNRGTGEPGRRGRGRIIIRVLFWPARVNPPCPASGVTGLSRWGLPIESGDACRGGGLPVEVGGWPWRFSMGNPLHEGLSPEVGRSAATPHHRPVFRTPTNAG